MAFTMNLVRNARVKVTVVVKRNGNDSKTGEASLSRGVRQLSRDNLQRTRETRHVCFDTRGTSKRRSICFAPTLDDTFFLPLIFSGGKKGAFLSRFARCRSLVCFPRSSWPTFTRLPSPLCSLHTSRGCNLRLTERKPKGSDRVVTRSARIGSLNEETRRCDRPFLYRLFRPILRVWLRVYRRRLRRLPRIQFPGIVVLIIFNRQVDLSILARKFYRRSDGVRRSESINRLSSFIYFSPLAIIADPSRRTGRKSLSFSRITDV